MFSTCNLTIGTHVVRLQVAPPGTPGLATSIAMGPNGAKMMFGDAGSKNLIQLGEIKDFGNVDCYTTTMTGTRSGRISKYPDVR